MSDSVMLRAELNKISSAATMPEGYQMRPCNFGDADQLGKLYFHSYEKGQACESKEASIEDIISSFNGDYGVFFERASLVVECGEKIVGAILVVEKNSWDELVTCPYIIELFIDKGHRQNNLAKNLILSSCEVLMNGNFKEVALTVAVENTPARRLYESIGFAEQ